MHISHLSTQLASVIVPHQLTIISTLSEFKTLLFSAASSCHFKSALIGPIWKPCSVSVKFSVQEGVSGFLTSSANLHRHQYLVSTGVNCYSCSTLWFGLLYDCVSTKQTLVFIYTHCNSLPMWHRISNKPINNDRSGETVSCCDYLSAIWQFVCVQYVCMNLPRKQTSFTIREETQVPLLFHTHTFSYSSTHSQSSMWIH